MSRILVASDSADFRTRVADAIGEPIAVIPGHTLPAAPSQLFQQLGPGMPIPEVVVLDTASGHAAGLDLAGKMHTECPWISVILASVQPEALALSAMRAGACDVVNSDAEPGELGQALHRAVQLARSASTGPGGDSGTGGSADARGRVISVASPKGGVGKTTVASNLAVSLARSAPGSTVLVDLDVQFGDVGTALNLDPEYSLLDVVRGPAVQDSMVLKTFLTQHETGLYAVCAPASPAEADTITAADVTQLLTTLASEFRYVVVDTAPGLDDHALAAIDQTNDLVLMTGLDVPGVRGLRKVLAILRDLGIALDGRHVVVNFTDAHSGLSKADVEATIGADVDVMLPRSRAAVIATNQGVPLLQSEMRDPLTKQLRVLADRFTPAPMRPKPTSVPGELAAKNTTATKIIEGRHRLRRSRGKK